MSDDARKPDPQAAAELVTLVLATARALRFEMMDSVATDRRRSLVRELDAALAPFEEAP